MNYYHDFFKIILFSTKLKKMDSCCNLICFLADWEGFLL